MDLLQKAIVNDSVEGVSDVLTFIITESIDMVDIENVPVENLKYFIEICGVDMYMRILYDLFRESRSMRFASIIDMDPVRIITSDILSDYMYSFVVCYADSIGDYQNGTVTNYRYVIYTRNKLLMFINKYSDKINPMRLVERDSEPGVLLDEWVDQLILHLYSEAEIIAYIIFKTIDNNVFDTIPSDYIEAFIKIMFSVGYPDGIIKTLMKRLSNTMFEFPSKRKDTRDPRFRLLQESV